MLDGGRIKAAGLFEGEGGEGRIVFIVDGERIWEKVQIVS